MPLSVEQIAAEAMLLSTYLRAELVESLDFPDGDAIQKSWREEAIRRRDEVRQGRVQTIPGDRVMAEVRQMLG